MQPDDEPEARPLTESQKLIHASPGSHDMLVVGEASVGQVGIVVADSDAQLATALAAGAAGQYAVVIDKPGDVGALLHAIAINVRARDPAKMTAARMAKGATGWLYEILASGQRVFRDYIRPALYAA